MTNESSAPPPPPADKNQIVAERRLKLNPAHPIVEVLASRLKADLRQLRVPEFFRLIQLRGHVFGARELGDQFQLPARSGIRRRHAQPAEVEQLIFRAQFARRIVFFRRATESSEAFDARFAGLVRWRGWRA